MNNSGLVIEGTSLREEVGIDRTPHLKKRESEVVKILDAIQGVKETKDWSTLKEFVFDGLVATLNREIQAEAVKDNPDPLKLNRLAGQLKWAEKYADLTRLHDVFRLELTKIRKILYGKNE